MEKRIYPQAIESVVMPEPFGRQSFNDAEKAVAALQVLYDRNTKFLRDSFAALAAAAATTASATAPSIRRSASPPIRSPRSTRARPTATCRRRGISRPPSPSPMLFESYLIEQLAADHAQSRRAGHRFGIDHADPAAFRLPRRHPCRRRGRRAHQAADPRPVRRAGPRRHRRPDRQRHLRGGVRRAAAAGAVHRAAHRLFAAPPVALHGDQPAAFPELRAVHQLPVLHRRVRRPRARPDGEGRRRLCRIRRAGQCHHQGRARRAQRRRGGAAPAADAGLSSEEAEPWRHHHGQYRRRPVQRQDDHRPYRGAAGRMPG